MSTPLSYQDRNALARNPALAFLQPGQLVYTPGKPQFSDLAASTLGNAGTPADGFDALFASVAGIVDGDLATLSVFDTILTGVGFVEGALDAVTFAPLARAYAAYSAAGDVALGEHDSATLPPPPKQPPAGPPAKNPPGGLMCKRRFPYAKDISGSEGSGDDPCAP